MNIKASKYHPEMKKPNQWRETEISEEWLRHALAPVLQQLRFVRSSSDVKKVILSEPTNGTYRLTYEVIRKEV